MTRPKKENIFLCNGAKCKGAEAMVLDYRASADERNVNLKLPQFVDQFNYLPDRILDLMEIAAYVFAADRSCRRGPKDAVIYNSWSRKMRFIVKVRDYDFWKQGAVNKALCDALKFMTGDEQYTFEFKPGHRTPPSGLFDREEFSLKVDKPTSVLLFSGGLDSLSGTVQQLENSDNDLLLISHRSGMPGTKKTQKLLVNALKGKHEGRIKHFSFECGLLGGRAPDETQRTRAFLFCSIAFAVAHQAGLNKCFAFENGVTSFNFARREDARKGRTSRTTHPKTHALLGQFLSRVSGQDFEIENPFWDQSKTDVISALGNSGSKELISSAVSCSSTFNPLGSGATHCGCCFQCIDRRLSAYAAGMQEFDDVGIYGHNVITQAMPDHEPKTAVIDYVRQACGFVGSSLDSFCDGRWLEVADATEFMKLPEDEAVDAIWELCKKHGGQISEGIVVVRNQHDNPLAPLVKDSLLDLLAARVHLKPYTPLEDDISNTEVVNKVFAKIDDVAAAVLPEAQRGSKTKQSASAGGKARAATYTEKYDEAREFIQKYHEDNPRVSFSQARKKAADKIDGVTESSLRKHIKKSDYPNW